jgi:hypothetical protein
MGDKGDNNYGAMDLAPAHVSMLSGSAAMAAATQSATIEAGIKARCALAFARPRKMADVRSRILGECERPGFASEAMYKIKRSSQEISGLSARFAESASRALTNIHTSTMVIFDDEEKRIIRVETMDLETNQTLTQEVTISKQHWRQFLRKGQEPLKKRTNSQNEVSFLVEMTEDDMRAKEHAMISIVSRNQVLKMLPADVKAEAQTIITATMLEDARKNLDRERAQAQSAFSEIGVSIADLTEYLGHGLQDLTAEESVELRKTWKAIDDGETTWAELMAQKESDASEPPRSRGEARRGRIDRGQVKAGDPTTHQDHDASAAAISAQTAQTAAPPPAKKAAPEAPATAPAKQSKKAAASKPAEKPAVPAKQETKPEAPAAKATVEPEATETPAGDISLDDEPVAAPVPTPQEIGKKIAAIVQARGVPAEHVEAALLRCFGTKANATKPDAPERLEAWLAEQGEFWKPAPAEEVTVEEGAAETSPELPPEPALPAQITWAHCLATALKAPQKTVNGASQSALDQEQRRDFLVKNVGEHVFTKGGSVDASKVGWGDYVTVRRELARMDLLAPDATVKIGNTGFEIPALETV